MYRITYIDSFNYNFANLELLCQGSGIPYSLKTSDVDPVKEKVINEVRLLI